MDNTSNNKNITNEEMLNVLNTLYNLSINGISKISLPIEDLVNDYADKYKNKEDASKALIKNTIIKCGTSGFITSFGGFLSMIATIPVNISSVMYMQLRMCCGIAKMSGLDINSEEVRTMILVCLTGNACEDILLQTGIHFGDKVGTMIVKKIPEDVLVSINKKVGYKLISKFGEEGTIGLTKVVPVLGGVIGGGVDVLGTRVIGRNAYNLFIEGKELDNNTIIDSNDIELLDDIDTLFFRENNEIEIL